MAPVNHLLLLLLTLVVVPCCCFPWDICTARRDFHRGVCAKVSLPCKKCECVAKRAADQAGVVFEKVIEAYKKKSATGAGYEVNLVFSAWTNECYGRFQHCVASKCCEGKIDVKCENAFPFAVGYKSGGFSYIPEGSDGPVLIAKYPPITSETRFNALSVGVKCRAAGEQTNPNCVSFVHPDKPGWYYVARDDGKFYFEPECNPTKPETFDEDTSFILTNEWFDGFGSAESLSMRGFYIIAGVDGFERLGEFEDTPEFKNSASVIVIDYSTKELFPCSSCDEIKAKKPDACSGDFVIMLADDTLKQVSCDFDTTPV